MLFVVFDRYLLETSDYGSGTDLDNRRKSSLSSIESEWNNFMFYSSYKENNSNRKRSRHYHRISPSENNQTKRMKISNRRQYFIRFSIDLTGQNIHYTIEYHHKIIFVPIYYDFYYLSWLQTYYYYYYYYNNSFDIFHSECEREIHGDLREFFDFEKGRMNGIELIFVCIFFSSDSTTTNTFMASSCIAKYQSIDGNIYHNEL